MDTYVALGDSISIDDYTKVVGGGAPTQLAKSLSLKLVDLTRDGNTTSGVLDDLRQMPSAADIITLTAGGNDLLLHELPDDILGRLEQVADHLETTGARVIMNTVYDPSDGDDEMGGRELGLSGHAINELRRRLNAINFGIRAIAGRRNFFLADLEELFRGHGLGAREPWFVQEIEPNLVGATAIAARWHELLASRDARPDF
jgi:lysophospholipase L1-like esterase